MPGVLPERLEEERRNPAEEPKQDEDDHDPEPKRRDRQPRDGKDSDSAVDPSILLERGYGSEGDGEESCEGSGHDGQLKAQLKANADLLHHGPASPHRLPEIKPADARNPVDQLVRRALVETQTSTLLIESFLGDISASSSVFELDDVAGHDTQQQEDDHRHGQQGGRNEESAGQDVALH